MSVDCGQHTVLLLLDLSAASDTTDDSILIQCLNKGRAFQEWFQVCLFLSVQKVFLCGNRIFLIIFSTFTQGSALGPLLFFLTCYLVKLLESTISTSISTLITHNCIFLLVLTTPITFGTFPNIFVAIFNAFFNSWSITLI